MEQENFLKPIHFLILSSLIFVIGCQESKPSLQLGGQQFEVELALSSKEWTKGLMYRESLPENFGMLFVGRSERPRSFWMRNTYVSLDIIYIGADRRIVSIAKATTPMSEASIPSEGPAQFVFEVKAGTADRLNLKKGDLAEFRFDLPQAVVD